MAVKLTFSCMTEFPSPANKSPTLIVMFLPFKNCSVKLPTKSILSGWSARASSKVQSNPDELRLSITMVMES